MDPEELPHELGRLSVDPDVTVAPRPYPHPSTLVRANLDLLPVIAAGGALGSLARWGLAEALPHPASAFAWGTFVANASGALLLGLLMAFVLGPWAGRRYLRPFLGVGVLGGYTTFSTWMLDTRGLLATGHVPLALGYLGGTLAAGMLAVVLGMAGGRAVIAWLGESADDTAPEEAA